MAQTNPLDRYSDWTEHAVQEIRGAQETAEKSQYAAHIYRHEAQAERERADAAEREYEALASFLMRVVWLVVGALVLLGVVAWAAAWAVG